MDYQQGSLFALRSYRVADRGEPYVAMNLEIVTKWQERIKTYQQRIKTERPHQSHLFISTEPVLIDPFSLEIFPEDFYRFPKEQGDACIYFVIDFDVPLLLYVGETNHSHKRWRGLHDCKNYLTQYRAVLHSHQQNSRIGITFYWDAPLQKQARLKLEQSFIRRWRSPFNKENWHYWHTPFIV